MNTDSWFQEEKKDRERRGWISLEWVEQLWNATRFLLTVKNRVQLFVRLCGERISLPLYNNGSYWASRRGPYGSSQCLATKGSMYSDCPSLVCMSGMVLLNFCSWQVSLKYLTYSTSLLQCRAINSEDRFWFFFCIMLFNHMLSHSK